MRLFFSVFISLSFITSFAQEGIKGRTVTETGEALPFATVYLKGTTIGTTSNGVGDFLLKTPSGQHTFVVQYVGYQTVEKQILVTSDNYQKQDFVLKEQAVQLKEVVVSSSDDDPAYGIIREAIKKRGFYEKEVFAFRCDTYLKGLQRLDEKPDRILGIKVTADTGIVYLSESVSKFAFEQPNKVSEQMISSKVSGDEQGFSFNQASDFNINLYQKSFFFEGLSERAFVSPIAPNAFLYYDYQLLGYYEEDGQLINKILLLPKRDSDPVFSGIIYVVEDSWRLKTVELELVKSRGIDFVDSVRINQVLAPIENDIWMPISQRFEFQFKVFGFKGSGYFVGIYSNYEVEPNYALFRKSGVYNTRLAKDEEEKNLFAASDFTAEVLEVQESSNKRDSLYWKDIRPIPLTGLEVKDYVIKDSIRVVKESKPYKDSVDHERNQLTMGNLLLTGYTHYNSSDNIYWNLPPIISIFQYNTVEGFVPELQPTFWVQEEGRTKYWIRPAMRYGFSDEKFKAKLEGSFRKLDKKDTRYYAGGGKYVSQFDEKEPISAFINSYVTLVNGDNFMKLFEKSFGYFRYQQEIKNGLYLTAEVGYASRDTLSNTSLEYSWTEQANENFTSNQPFNEEVAETGFATNQALTLDLKMRIRFRQQYATRPDRKINYPSDLPEVYLSYRKGIQVAGSDVDFDFASINISDDFRIGLIGSSKYVVEAGAFLNDNSLTFVDFHHFTGNRTSFRGLEGIQSFQLLDYYQFSTSRGYLEVHYEHHFNEFIFNKIPLIKKLNLQAVGSANYLRTNTLGNYMELGAGVEHIFRVMRIDYWWGYRDANFVGSGFRIGVGF